MDNIEKAKAIVEECAQTIDRIKVERQTIVDKQKRYQDKLESLEGELGQALVRAMFGTDVPAEVNLIRKQIRGTKAFLTDAPLILAGLDLFETEQKDRKLDPQRIIRNDNEEKRMIQLNMDLQKKLLAMAAESEEFMHRDSFIKTMEKFRRNALSLNQEQAADDFIRSLRG